VDNKYSIIFNMKTYTLTFRQVDKQSFDDLKSGVKSVETRANTVKYQKIEVGDTLTFVCEGDKFSKVVTKVYRWPDIDTMVKEISFKKIMPTIESVEEMRKAYYSYPDYEQKIKEFGIIGFEFN